jgi:NAD(P)-dependent dehydrogenase (short-subunit alcohol dehydrogenase family)
MNKFDKEMTMKIKNAIAFVTGANRGLGLAFARELLKRGATKVYAGMRNPAGFSEPGIVAIQLDVTDAASVAAAAALTADTTLLINNAGIAHPTGSTLDPAGIDAGRAMFETNYVGLIRVSQAFAPHLSRNGGGAVLNVLSYASWTSGALLASYAATKSAAWSYTNAFRGEVRANGTQVVGLHVGFIDTDMTQGFDVEKSSPQQVVIIALDGVEAGLEEVLADDATRELKQSLSSPRALYLGELAAA